MNTFGKKTRMILVLAAAVVGFGLLAPKADAQGYYQSYGNTSYDNYYQHNHYGQGGYQNDYGQSALAAYDKAFSGNVGWYDAAMTESYFPSAPQYNQQQYYYTTPTQQYQQNYYSPSTGYAENPIVLSQGTTTQLDTNTNTDGNGNGQNITLITTTGDATTGTTNNNIDSNTSNDDSGTTTTTTNSGGTYSF